MRVGITEKRLKNRRFMRTEEAILRVFFEEDNYISLEQMAKKAGVARSTVYRHHGAIREIVPDYERYVMVRYRVVMKKTMRKKMTLKQIYFQMLLFILANRQIFMLLLRNKNFTVLPQMINGFRKKIERTARLTEGSDKIFKIYEREIAVLVEEWAKRGFSGGEIGRLLDDIMYLTETIKVRLGPLRG